MSWTAPERQDRLPARERMLAVADALFYAEGIRAVGIDRLLAESGVAKASLYQHFGSKDELVAAYLHRRIDRWQGYLDGALPGVEGGPAAQILTVFELLGAWMTGDSFRGCPFINAAAEFPAADHPAHRAAVEHRTRMRARFAQLTVRLEGVDEPDGLADSLMLLYDGALVAADLGSGATAATSVVTTVRRLLATP